MEFSRVLSRHAVSSNLVSSKSEDYLSGKVSAGAVSSENCTSIIVMDSLCSEEEASSSIGILSIFRGYVHRNVQQQLILAHWVPGISIASAMNISDEQSFNIASPPLYAASITWWYMHIVP